MSKAFTQHSAAFYDGLYRGRTLADMANEFGVSEVTVWNWRTRARKGEVPGTVNGKPCVTDNPYITMLRKRRLNKAMTMEELSQKSSMPKNQLSYLERGKRQPLLDTWLALIKALGGKVEVTFND